MNSVELAEKIYEEATDCVAEAMQLRYDAISNNDNAYLFALKFLSNMHEYERACWGIVLEMNK